MVSRRQMIAMLAGGVGAGFAVPVIVGLGSRGDGVATIPSVDPMPGVGSQAPVGARQAPLARATGPLQSQELPQPRVPRVQIPVRQIAIRRSADRGHFDYGWLKTHHSFSFGRYWDRKHMGFRGLRVINEDWISAGRGFPMHPHRDMEIVTYILSGALQHRDSIGNGSVIRPGEIQRMSAGTGIRHSEFNPSGLASVHLLQIWIAPDRRGHTPSYAQQPIPQLSSPDPVRLIASPDGALGSVKLNAQVRLYACHLAAHQELHFEVRPQRHAWVQIAKGQLTAHGQTLKQGDGFSTSDDGWIKASASEASELLIFDLA